MEQTRPILVDPVLVWADLIAKHERSGELALDTYVICKEKQGKEETDNTETIEKMVGGALVSQPKILTSFVSHRFLHSSHPRHLHRLFRYDAGLSLSLSPSYMYTYTD